jgi:two-component system copper resistance phosphate regulon response regulator CusR
MLRVGRILREYGWHVAQQQAPSAPSGRMDLAILAVPPGQDHAALIGDLRRQTQPHLLLLTADHTVSTRAQALSLGADDLIEHQCPAHLLISRIGALLRLRPGGLAQTYRIGDLSIDVSRRHVRREARQILLSQREFQLLVLLAAQSGRVMPRSEIIDALWQGNQGISDNAVDALASRLRRRVDEPFDSKILHTIRGVGYSLCPIEHWALAG